MFCILKSKLCLVIFISFLFLIYFLIPDKMFYGLYNILAYLFIFSTSITITCIFRNAKERIILNRRGGKSLVAIILSLFGIMATQVCGIGAPLCGAAIVGGIGFSFIPVIAQSFFDQYSIYIIILAIFGQVYSLYVLKCLDKTYCDY